MHLVAAGFPWLSSLSATAEYWVVGGDPVTIEIRFDEAVPDPGDALRQVRERLGYSVHVHEEGHEAERVSVKVSLPPGRHVVGPLDAARTEDHRTLVLDKGWPYRLMRWEPGGSPVVLGEYLLPWRPFGVALESKREEAFFATLAFDGACVAVEACLWRWQPGAQPPVAPLPGLWTVRSMYWTWVFPRGDDLLVQTFQALLVVDRDGELIATLVDHYITGAAVGPAGEVAAFVVRDRGRGWELDLTLFDAALETYRTWEGICPQGRFNDGMPDVHPVWHGDEIFFLALDDQHYDPPMYYLSALDVHAGSVRRVLGPFATGCRLGQSHYALLGQWGADWVLWDAATGSLRSLPSARELAESQPPWPVAVGGDWAVLGSESGLLGWHPSMGVTRLGHGMAVVRAGDAFLWWTEVTDGR